MLFYVPFVKVISERFGAELAIYSCKQLRDTVYLIVEKQTLRGKKKRPEGRCMV